MDICFN